MIWWIRIHLPMQGTRGRSLEFNPWSKKIPHAVEPLSLRTTATEPTHSTACALQQEQPLHRRAHAPQPGSSPYSLQLEETYPQQRRPTTTKNKDYFLKFIKIQQRKATFIGNKKERILMGRGNLWARIWKGWNTCYMLNHQPVHAIWKQ